MNNRQRQPQRSSSVIMKPSFYSLAITGILVLVAAVMLYQQWHMTNRIEGILLLGILIGIHGILHLGYEVVYGYSPLETGRWL